MSTSKRVALITGGTRGIGRAISMRLAEDGLLVALAFRDDQSSADEAIAALRTHDPTARAYRADITDPASVDTLVNSVRGDIGPIEVLINNAYRAGRAPKKTHETAPDELREDLATNLVGQFLVTRACLPSMLEKRYGRIVFIGSIAMRGERGRVAYAIAKSGLVGLTKTIAQEYAKEGITANILSPGFVEAGAFVRMPPEVRERALRTVPSRRAGRAEEIAAAVSYLCSEDSGYTTGQILGVDGGAT